MHAAECHVGAAQGIPQQRRRRIGYTVMSKESEKLAETAEPVPAPVDADGEGPPRLVAVDGNKPFEFTINPDDGTIDAFGRETRMLNMLANWIRMLPQQAPFPPPPNMIQARITNAVSQAKEQGNTRFRQKDWEGAIKHYSVAISMSGNRPLWESHEVLAEELSVCLANRSAAYAAVNAYIEALCDADAAIKIRRDWSKGHFRKGQALAGLRRYGEARAAYTLGLQIDPGNQEFERAIAELPRP